MVILVRGNIFRKRCRDEMTYPETQHDRLVNTLKQLHIDNPGIAEVVTKVILSEQEGDEWLKEIFNDIRKTKMYKSFPESLSDYDRITLTFFANVEEMKAQFPSSLEPNFYLNLNTAQALVEYRSLALIVAAMDKSRMSKDDFDFMRDLLDKADDDEPFKRITKICGDNEMYIDFLNRKEDALKAKIQTVSESKEDTFAMLERIKRIKKVLIDEDLERRGEK